MAIMSAKCRLFGHSLRGSVNMIETMVISRTLLLRVQNDCMLYAIHGVIITSLLCPNDVATSF